MCLAIIWLIFCFCVARLLCFNIMSIKFFYFVEIVKETRWTFYIGKYLCFNYNTGSIIYTIKILKWNHYMWNQCRLRVTSNYGCQQLVPMVIPKKGFGCVYLALTSDYGCWPLVDYWYQWLYLKRALGVFI